MKKLLTVALQLFFPWRHIRRDIFGSLVVFLVFFIPMAGWQLIPMDAWKLIGSVFSAGEEARVYGGVYDVPKFHWAQIRNRNGVRTEEFQLRRFEYCLTRYKGSVQEIINHSTWWSSWRGRVLVEYTIPDGQAATGVLCPSGTVYYLLKEELASFPDRFRERQLLEQEKYQKVPEARD
ncbi:MAG: hypothetical protein O7A69_07370 [SAR324 cluster bacterium]|nr:hypothetical protein [SAR324 cluster bacterium]